MGKIAVICYGKAQLFKSRKRAMDFFFDGAVRCDGAEAERYFNVYASLKAGESFKLMSRPDLPPFVTDDEGCRGKDEKQDICAIIKTLENAVAEYGTEKDFWNKETA